MKIKKRSREMMCAQQLKEADALNITVLQFLFL